MQNPMTVRFFAKSSFICKHFDACVKNSKVKLLNSMVEENSQSIPTQTQISELQTPPEFSRTALAWLDARPAAPDTCDLFHVNVDNLAVKLVREVLDNRNFEFPLETVYPAAEWFNHFYFEAKNRERVFGNKNLGLGYPMVFGKTGGQRIAAPLFFFQLAIEPHQQHPDHWTISRQEQHQIVPNYPFFYLIDRMHGSDFSKKVRELAAARRMTTSAMSEISDGIRLLLDMEEQGLTLSVLPLPGQQEMEYFIQKGVICWSGVLGVFPETPMAVESAPPVLSDADQSTNQPKNQSTNHQFTILPLDPSQRAVLKSAQTNTLTVVEGASGSGKTYTISAIIANALANGKKCLVVSHNLNALRRGQKFLLEKGVGDLSFILRDKDADRLMLADMLRAAANNRQKHSFEEETFKTLLMKTRRDSQKLDDAWQTLHSPIFGEQSFREVVGRFLRANRAVGKELLLSLLHPSDFEFSKNEFERIAEAIRQSEPLFKKFPMLGHPLSKLQNHFFLENEPDAGAGLARAHTQLSLDRATALHHIYISKQADYAESLTELYSDHYARLALLTKRVREELEDGVNRYGSNFESSASVTEKIAGSFSEKYREITAAKEKIGQDFEAMRRLHAAQKYFEFDFPKNFDLRNIPKISEITRDFDTALKNWRKRIPAIVREDLKRWSQKAVHSNLLEFKKEVSELENSLDGFVEEFNQLNLYGETTKHEALTVPMRRQFLEQTIERLEETQFALRDFSDFHVWQKHWLSLDPLAQKVVAALCKIKPKNWVAAFESWYLHHLLTNEFSANLVWDDETVGNFSKNHVELQRKLPFQISALWQKRKVAALQKLGVEDPKGLKDWFGKNNRTNAQPAEILYKNYLETLTEILPVLLVPPQVALDLFQNSNLKFDLILVDEAHNIMRQKGYHLFSMGKNMVLFGDSKQDMTPNAEDDILEFCKGIGAKTLSLDYQHQYCPEQWIDFNKVAFETPFQRIPTNLSAADATIVENTGGRFDESSRTNEAEARQIIDWLNLIEPLPTKNYPTVGIACATVEQRDLIAGQLLKIRQRKAAGHEKIQQLHLNGMGVYQFGELQGQHVDVLLVSLVHGETGVSGQLSDSLDFWNTQLGINQLHVVLTRPTSKIFIAHSLPADLAKLKTGRGTDILNYLVKYAQLTHNAQSEAAAELLAEMKTRLKYPADFFPSDIFMEEVEIALQPYFEPGRIQRNATIEGVTVPLLVQSHGDSQHFNILLFDGVLAKTAVSSFEWESRLQNFFSKNRIEYVPTLSVQWWKSPRQEARKLAGRIISRENS